MDPRGSVAVATRPRRAPAVAARTAIGALTAVACSTSTTAGADAGQLLGGLAGDVGVLGEAQPDAAALAVDLDDTHVDLIALVEHVLDALHALTRGDVRDVQQPVGALGELDEGAEGRRLDDLAGVLVADLDLLHHHA